jgi:hypothetical protein
MHRVVVVLIALLLASPAIADGVQKPYVVRDTFRNAPFWYDFVRGLTGGYCGTAIATCISITRTTVGNAQTVSGTWTAFGTGALRRTDKGLLIEQAATNNLLWSRDWTNAAWTKTNANAALDAIGIDGVAASATTLTATAGNATALQSITLGSASYTGSVAIKCVTCTGNVQITIDNGTTWTTANATSCQNQNFAAAVLSTTTFVRCRFQQTLANPVVGVRIVNSGDSVVVDGAQLEAAISGTGAAATISSPIYTTTVAATRNADDLVPTGALLNCIGNAVGSLYARTGPITALGTNTVVNGSATNRFLIYYQSTTNNTRTNHGGTILIATLGSGSVTTTDTKSVLTHTSGVRALVGNGGTVVTDATTVAVSATAFIGRTSASASYLNGYLKELACWPSILTNAQALALSRL